MIVGDSFDKHTLASLS